MCQSWDVDWVGVWPWHFPAYYNLSLPWHSYVTLSSLIIAIRGPKLLYCLCLCPDYCSPGGDAEEGERAGRSQEETGSDQTATVQVPAQRAARRRQLSPQTHGHCCTIPKQCEEHIKDLCADLCPFFLMPRLKVCCLQQLKMCWDWFKKPVKPQVCSERRWRSPHQAGRS